LYFLRCLKLLNFTVVGEAQSCYADVKLMWVLTVEWYRVDRRRCWHPAAEESHVCWVKVGVSWQDNWTTRWAFSGVIKYYSTSCKSFL